MILILSEKFDTPTQNVVKKPENNNAKYQIICVFDLLEKSFSLVVNKNVINFDNVELER